VVAVGGTMRTRLALLLPSLLCLTVVSPGCSSIGGTGDGDKSVCRMQPVAGCTGDCTWAEVLHHDEHCAVCAAPGGRPDYQGYDVAACGGYHLLRARGGDAGSVRFYDAGTGELIGQMATGQACLDGNLWPAGCESAAFVPHAAWCDPYRADGTGTKCCLSTETLDIWYGDTNVCSWSANENVACGDYDVSLWPASGADGLYYDGRTGDLIAAVATSQGQTACFAGPPGGFTAPSCPAPPVPVDCSAADGGAPTN
jgi:hypothetical protein